MSATQTSPAILHQSISAGSSNKVRAHINLFFSTNGIVNLTRFSVSQNEDLILMTQIQITKFKIDAPVLTSAIEKDPMF